MLLLVSAVCLLAATALSAPASGDFDVVSGSYEFIYHQQQELLLTIHDTACYHTHLRGLSCPLILETQIMFQIRDRERISHSSLQTLRDTFQDLLANFHCLDKTVYRLEIHSDFKCEGSGDHDD